MIWNCTICTICTLHNVQCTCLHHDWKSQPVMIGSNHRQQRDHGMHPDTIWTWDRQQICSLPPSQSWGWSALQDPTGCLPPKEHTMEYNQPKNELFSLKVDKVNFNQTDRMIWAESQIYRKAQKLKSYCVPDSERLTVRHVAKSIPDDISLEQLPKQRMPMTDRVQRNFIKQSKQRTRMNQVSLLQMPSVDLVRIRCLKALH